MKVFKSGTETCQIGEDKVLGALKETRMYRYKDLKNDRNVKHTLLTLADKNRTMVRIDGSAESQFYRLLRLNIGNLEIMNWEDRNKLIGDRYQQRLKNNNLEQIVLRFDESGRVIAAVTQNYAPIEHHEAFDLAFWTLYDSGLEPEEGRKFERSGSYNQVVLLKSRFTEILRSGLLISNSIMGRASLSLSAYHEISVCSNGLVSGKLFSQFSARHIGSKDGILREFGLAVVKVADELDLSKEIGMAGNEIVNLGQATGFIGTLDVSRKTKEAVLLSWNCTEKQDKTRWKMVNILTTIAQYEKSPNKRFYLERRGFDLLKNGRVMNATPVSDIQGKFETKIEVTR